MTTALSRRTGVRTAALAFAAGTAIVLWGGYRRHWHWTGFHKNDTLWDWLEMLALPVAVAIAPLWARQGRRLDRRRRTALAACAAGFVALVVVGYAADLHWTGFPGNRLWDWLELLVLPLAVATLPIWYELHGERRRRVHATLAVAAAVLAVLALGGYLGGWTWTGFRGNTLFDWLHLFLAPLLLPLVLVPAVRGWFARELEDDED
jgi:MFS family permease